MMPDKREELWSWRTVLSNRLELFKLMKLVSQGKKTNDGIQTSNTILHDFYWTILTEAKQLRRIGLADFEPATSESN